MNMFFYSIRIIYNIKYICISLYCYIDIHNPCCSTHPSMFQAEPRIGLCFTPVDGASAAAKVRGAKTSKGTHTIHVGVEPKIGGFGPQNGW